MSIYVTVCMLCIYILKHICIYLCDIYIYICKQGICIYIYYTYINDMMCIAIFFLNIYVTGIMFTLIYV